MVSWNKSFKTIDFLNVLKKLMYFHWSVNDFDRQEPPGGSKGFKTIGFSIVLKKVDVFHWFFKGFEGLEPPSGPKNDPRET